MLKNLVTSVVTGAALLKKGKIMKKFTYTFTKKSQIVKSWVSLIVAGEYTFDDVPALFNLRKVVKSVLDSLEKEKAEDKEE